MLKKLMEKLKWLDPFTYVDLYVMPRVNPGNSEVMSLAVYVVFAFVFAFIIFNLLGLLLGTGSPMVIVVSSSMEPLLYRGDVVVMGGIAPKDIKAESVDIDLLLVDSLPLWDYAMPFCTKNGSTTEVECRNLPLSCPANHNTTSIEFKGGQRVPVNTNGDIIVYTSTIKDVPIQIIHRVVTKINASDGVYLLTKGDNACNSNIDQEIGIASGAIKAEKIEGRALFWIPKIGCVKLWVFDDLSNLLLTGRLPPNFSGIC